MAILRTFWLRIIFQQPPSSMDIFFPAAMVGTVKQLGQRRHFPHRCLLNSCGWHYNFLEVYLAFTTLTGPFASATSFVIPYCCGTQRSTLGIGIFEGLEDLSCEDVKSARSVKVMRTFGDIKITPAQTAKELLAVGLQGNKQKQVPQ